MAVLPIAVTEDRQPALPYSAAARAAATACEKATSPAFFDNFAPPDPGWGPVGQTYFFRDGQMVLKPRASSPEPWIYTPLVFSDATICAEFKFPTQNQLEESKGAAGVMFWAADFKNYYLAMINVDGVYSVFRRIESEWATVIPRTRSEAIRQGADAINRIKVSLAHNVASIIINDATVIAFHGHPANASGAVGLYAQSGERSDAEWRFSGIVVSN